MRITEITVRQIRNIGSYENIQLEWRALLEGDQQENPTAATEALHAALLEALDRLEAVNTEHEGNR